MKLSLDTHVLQQQEQLAPAKKYIKDPARRQRNFEAMREASKIVYKDILEHGNEFYFCWKFDTRGRMYNQGYHVTIQGNEYKKALIDLAEKHIIRLT